ncbi:MAG: P-II family nitrogen regulator [Oscillospiraceae bacterium]|jgi:nitrogen regulatory protein PII|nr:P-II family nitrogen regulator [Oscillospiraceae bacterium]
MAEEKMKAMFIVVNAGFAENVLEVAREAGVVGATILNVRGEGVHRESILGITVDTEKEMILSIVSESTADKAMRTIKEKAGIKTPAHSFCFTMPVDEIVGIGAPPQPPR